MRRREPELTPGYKLPMLSQVAPDARILVMLRDPLQRFLSGIAHFSRMAEAFGLDPGKWHMSGEISRPAGAPSGPKPRLGRAARDAVRGAYQPEVERLLADFPELDAMLWPTAWD
jgi:hypothetical protein